MTTADVTAADAGAYRRRSWLIFGISAAIVLAVSQLSSYLVQSRFEPYESYAVNSVLHITYVRNTGGVFGILPGKGAAFAAVSIVIIVLLTRIIGTSSAPQAHFLFIGLIVGAAAANLTDRLIYGAVIDFIDIRGIPYWGYVFNTADMAIHLGAWPFFLDTLLRGSGETSRAGTAR